MVATAKRGKRQGQAQAGGRRLAVWSPGEVLAIDWGEDPLTYWRRRLAVNRLAPLQAHSGGLVVWCIFRPRKRLELEGGWALAAARLVRGRPSPGLRGSRLPVPGVAEIVRV